MADDPASVDARPACATDFGEEANPATAAATATGSPSASSGGVWEAAALIGHHTLEQLTDLENKKKKLCIEKQALQKDIRNAERKRLRLKEKARGLSDSDLLDILASRATAKAKAHAKAKSKAKAAA